MALSGQKVLHTHQHLLAVVVINDRAQGAPQPGPDLHAIGGGAYVRRSDTGVVYRKFDPGGGLVAGRRDRLPSLTTPLLALKA